MTIQSWDSTQTDDTSDDSTPISEENTTGDDDGNSQSTTSQSGDLSPLLQTLQTELEETKSRLNDLTIISQQALADLQNFKKRTEEEKKRMMTFANSNLISELLPVLDNIDRAVSHIPEEPTAKEWAQGIIGILKQLEQILQDKGLNPIENDQQEFDPNIHEAIMTKAGPADQILQQLQKGYRLGEKILRRAKVTVGHGEEDQPKENKHDHKAKN